MKLSLPDRFTHLIFSYWFGPILGLRQRLVVIDRQYNGAEQIIAALYFGTALVIALSQSTPVAMRFGLWMMILTTLLYSASRIEQLVSEYRIYLSVFGFALTVAGLASYFSLTYILLPLIVLYAIQSRRRIRLYSDPVRFWSDAALYCPTVREAAKAEKRYAGVLSDVDRLILLRAGRGAPVSVADWLDRDDLDQSHLSDLELIMHRLMTEYPNQPVFLRNYGLIRYYRHSFEAAGMSSFLDAVSANCKDYLSMCALGEICIKLGDYTSASYWYEYALEQSPDSYMIRLKVMELAERNNRGDVLNQSLGYFKSKGMIYVTEGMLKANERI